MLFNVTVTVRLAPELMALANRILAAADQSAAIVSVTQTILERTARLSTALSTATKDSP